MFFVFLLSMASTCIASIAFTHMYVLSCSMKGLDSESRFELTVIGLLMATITLLSFSTLYYFEREFKEMIIAFLGLLIMFVSTGILIYVHRISSYCDITLTQGDEDDLGFLANVLCCIGFTLMAINWVFS